MAKTFLGMSASERKLQAIVEGKWLNPDLQIEVKKLSPVILDALANAVIGALPTSTQSLKDNLAEEIPLAHDGDLIGSEYHNLLRQAVLKLAERADGGGAAGGSRVLSLAPTFSPVSADNGAGGWARVPEWVPLMGLVVRPPPGADGLSGCDGWMQVRLPEGYRIATVTVTGKRSGGTTLGGNGFMVQLLAQKLNESATTVLFNLNIADTAGDPFSLPAAKQVNDDQLVIRGGTFKYFMRATLIGANAAAVVALFGFQITCVAV